MCPKVRSQMGKLRENSAFIIITRKIRSCLELVTRRKRKWKKIKEPENEGSSSSSSSELTSRRKASSLMESLIGVLRIKIKRGINLAVRDVHSSDPYVVVKMGKQKLKTRVIKNDVNPEWNEDLTLFVIDPDLPVKLIVYDHDMFSKDDKMGDVEFDLKAYIDALSLNFGDMANDTVITRMQPTGQNCLSEETCITYVDDKLIQDLRLKLRNIESGELEIQLQWIQLPSSKGL